MDTLRIPISAHARNTRIAISPVHVILVISNHTPAAAAAAGLRWPWCWRCWWHCNAGTQSCSNISEFCKSASFYNDTTAKMGIRLLDTQHRTFWQWSVHTNLKLDLKGWRVKTRLAIATHDFLKVMTLVSVFHSHISLLTSKFKAIKNEKQFL